MPAMLTGKLIAARLPLLLLWLVLLVHVHAAPHHLQPRGRSPSPPRSSSPSRSPSKKPPSPKHLNLDLTLRPPGSSPSAAGSSSAVHAAQPPKDKHVRPAAHHAQTDADSHLTAKHSLKRKWWNVPGATSAATARSRVAVQAQPRPAVHDAENTRQMNLSGAPKKKWWNEPGATKPKRGTHTWRPDDPRARKLMKQRQGQGPGQHDLSQHPDKHDKGGGGGGRPGSPGGAAGTHAVG